jgi:hypothetical protein
MFGISTLLRRNNFINVISVLLLLTIRSQTSFAQGNSNKQSPQLKRTIQMLSGKWQFKNGKQIGSEYWHCGLGCYSIIEDYYSTSPTDTLQGTGIVWWDSAQNYFKVTWCTNKNTDGCLSSEPGSAWKDDSLFLYFSSIVEGKKIIYKEIFSDFTRSSFTQTLYRIEQNNKQELIFEYHCFKE